MLGKIASDQVFKSLDSLQYGTLKVTTPDGKTRIFQGHRPGDSAHIELREWDVFTNMIRRGDIGFADDYRKGHWETDNLTALTTLGLVNRSAVDKFIKGSPVSRTLSMLSYLVRMNTLAGSRRNILAHYDLGNDFYELWLDPSMTYSSALYKNTGDTLQQAQHNKYDRILDRLDNNSGSLLEIGCGWGGFAARAQARGDFAYKGITLSDEQHRFAQQQTQGKIVLEDYRHQDGKFDHIVSIEMFEAVGERYWKTYFGKVASLLKKDGKAIIQTITMNDADFDRYRRGGDFIRSFIFPGGMLPSPTRFKEEARAAGLKTSDRFFFGQDYARTLTQWLENFDQKRDEVKALGFDDQFIRLWRFYLAACAAGFRSGRTDVMQIELSHA